LHAIAPDSADAAKAIDDLVQGYIKDLGSSYFVRRDDAIEALGTIGPAAEAAVPFLLDMLDESDSTRFYAAQALLEISSDASVIEKAKGVIDLY
jgi:HEAT repeat protein